MQTLLATFCLAAAMAAEGETARRWDFEDAAAGSLPAAWSAARTGRGPGSDWVVQVDASAPAGGKVLVQTSAQAPRPTFNLCVASDTRYCDVALSVAVKALRGEIDQGGGPVWRYQDANHYYIARLNPLEWNYRVYKVVDGKRVQLASADLKPVAEGESLADQWHTLRIVHRGESIRCYLNGKLLLEAADGAIAAAGRVGLWTKADAVTAFDDLSVAEAAP
jgi:hypothetical protein